MKGIVYTKLGTPEVLKFRDIEKPTPQKDQILVRVMASSVNASDYAQFDKVVKTGKVSAFFKVKEKVKDKKTGKVLGGEAAGIVEAVGSDVDIFKVGDAVFGITPDMLGAWAEYVCMDEKSAALKPERISFEEAATLPMAGTTALAAVRAVQAQKGQEILVYGASGGVGQFIVQILKSKEAVVTGVCSTRNVELVRQMGADHVVDYKEESVFENGKSYDAIIAVNGYNAITKYKKSLRDGGIYVAIGGPLQGVEGLLLGPFMGIGNKRKFTFATFFSEIKRDSLPALSQLAENGKITPFIETVCPLREVPEMIADTVKKHPQGKIVISMEKTAGTQWE